MNEKVFIKIRAIQSSLWQHCFSCVVLCTVYAQETKVVRRCCCWPVICSDLRALWTIHMMLYHSVAHFSNHVMTTWKILEFKLWQHVKCLCMCIFTEHSMIIHMCVCVHTHTMILHCHVSHCSSLPSQRTWGVRTLSSCTPPPLRSKPEERASPSGASTRSTKGAKSRAFSSIRTDVDTKTGLSVTASVHSPAHRQSMDSMGCRVKQ